MSVSLKARNVKWRENVIDIYFIPSVQRVFL